MFGEEESIEVTEEAKIVALDIFRRGYHWSDYGEESFAEYIDRMGEFGNSAVYTAGSKVLLKICKQARTNDRAWGGIMDPIWKDLNITPQSEKDIEGIEYCCGKIIEIMRL